MDYLWRRYSPRKFYELDLFLKFSSPSIEIGQRKDNVVFVNPLPRFSDIFHSLLRRKDFVLNNEKDVVELSNCLLHFLAQLDQIIGVSTNSLLEEMLDQALSSGCFGERAKQIYGELQQKSKRIILHFLREQETKHGRRLYFREVVEEIFPKSKVHFYHADDRFLICLQQKENDADKKCMKLIGTLFLDVSSKYRIYWEYPFGIIGKKQTMHLNQMRLY